MVAVITIVWVPSAVGFVAADHDIVLVVLLIVTHVGSADPSSVAVYVYITSEQVTFVVKAGNT